MKYKGLRRQLHDILVCERMRKLIADSLDSSLNKFAQSIGSGIQDLISILPRLKNLTKNITDPNLRNVIQGLVNQMETQVGIHGNWIQTPGGIYAPRPGVAGGQNGGGPPQDVTTTEQQPQEQGQAQERAREREGEIQEAVQTLRHLGQTFLGRQKQNMAALYPHSYQTVIDLQKRLAGLTNINNLSLANLDEEALTNALAFMPNVPYKSIITLIDNAMNEIQRETSDPRAGMGDIDNKIKVLNQHKNTPVEFMEPGTGRFIPAVVVQARPNVVTLRTSRGRIISVPRTDPYFEDFVDSIRIRGWGERFNPLVQLKSLFYEKERGELVKLATKLDLMGLTKEADRVDRLLTLLDEQEGK